MVHASTSLIHTNQAGKYDLMFQKLSASLHRMLVLDSEDLNCIFQRLQILQAKGINGL